MLFVVDTVDTIRLAEQSGDVAFVVAAESADPSGQALPAALAVRGRPVSTVQAHGAPGDVGWAEQAMEARAEPRRFLHTQRLQGQCCVFCVCVFLLFCCFCFFNKIKKFTLKPWLEVCLGHLLKFWLPCF